MDKNIRVFASSSGKTVHVGDHVSIYVENESKVMLQKHEVKINWSCVGSVSIEKAEKFNKELRQAITLAKKEVK